MSRRGRVLCLALAPLMLSVASGAARSTDAPQYTVESFETDAVGDPEHPGRPAKALQDTVWMADWTFDVGGSCTSQGWVKRDNRIVNDGQVYWSVDNRFDGLGGVVAGKAAILGKHELCWARDGYGNDWDQSIVLKYAGAGATLTFQKASDSEAGFDFVTVEADSLGLSEARVNLCVNPRLEAADFRSVLARVSGVDAGSVVGPLALPNFGPGTHEVYIRFESGSTFSDEDGEYPTAYGAGLVVDNITVTGALAYSENFEGALNPAVQFANTANAAGFCTAPWLRLKHYITDNDKCTENTSCAWLDTDPLRTAYFPDMAFGPDAAVVHNWLDDLLVSPWIHLPPAPAGTSTVLSFRRFPGNTFSTGAIVQGWRVRTRRNIDNTDTPAPGDVVPCVSAWGHESSFNTLSTFAWMTSVFDMTPHFSALGEDLQISFRTTDWGYIGQNNIVTLNPGPGPYLDRVRIGRCAVTGPILSTGADTRSQAQDCFPTLRNTITPGEHFSPDGGNRFGTCAFSAGLDLGATGSVSNLITADSIFLESVVDTRGTGGIASVKFLAAITAGVHAGKAPAPYVVGANGFFEILADSARTPGGVVIANRWFVDLDDTYFRGGDVVKYVWLASDQDGGAASSPAGLLAAPVSVAQAELQTGGLREVSFLPAVDWAPSYVARVQADAHGDLDPTPPEITASTQRNCILYFQKSSANKNSGAANRTAFQYSLDRCGYAGHYDEYDCQGYGNTNNQLGGRATVAQCSGYALLIQDDGRSNLVPNLPDGSSAGQRINQSQWYRNYLSQGATGLVLTASLWLLGENTAFQSPVPLLMTDMGLANVVDDQAVRVNPDVVGLGTFRFANGVEPDFTPGRLTLNGGCPTVRAFDGATAAGTAIVTHQYRGGATAGLGAVVMNASAALHRNTIWMGFGWMDLRDAPGAAPGTLELTLMQKILGGVLPVNCIRNPDPTDVGGDPGVEAVPAVTALHANVPNPFNPATRIAFDLAHAGAVRLRVFDVAGHAVKTLVDGATPAGRHEVTWTGLDDAGRRVSSGVYFYQLITDGFSQTRRMALLK